MVCCRLFFLHITVKWSYSCKFVSCSIVIIVLVFAQTTLYHCTIASYHCTYCVSLHSILGPALPIIKLIHNPTKLLILSKRRIKHGH